MFDQIQKIIDYLRKKIRSKRLKSIINKIRLLDKSKTSQSAD